MTLHAETLLVSTAFVTTAVAVMFLVARGMHLAVEGVVHWSQALFLIALGLWLITIAHETPTFALFGLTLGNAFLIASYFLVWNGLRLFHGAPGLSLMACTSIVFLSAIGFLWNSNPIAGYTNRTYIYSSVAMVLSVACSLEIFRARKTLSPAEGAAAILYISDCAFHLFRIINMLVTLGSEDTYGGGDLVAINYLRSQILLVGLTFCFTLMAAGRLQETLDQQATLDPLTEIFNRRAFLSHANRIFALAQRRASPTALLLMDIDRFKLLNDTHGHQIGDIVLREFAETAKRSLRAGDVFARHGGEEFVALLPETEKDDAVAVAERLRQSIEFRHIVSGGTRIPVTVSIGISSCNTGETPLGELMALADKALYQAKAAGRNRTELCASSHKPLPHGLFISHGQSS